MLKHRLKKLQSQISHPILIKKKENLFYLTGRSFMNGYLLISPFRRHSEGPKGRRISHPRKGSFAGAQDDAIIFFGDGLEKVDGIKTDSLKNIGKYLQGEKNLEIEDIFTFAEYNYLRIKNKELGIKIKPGRSFVDEVRAVKEPEEIKKKKKSMQIVEAVFKLVRKEIKKPAMTEIKLAQFIQNSGLKMGAEDMSFPAIVASGVHAAIPHHVK